MKTNKSLDTLPSAVLK